MPKIPTSLVVLALGCALLLPMLGSYGLWDPLEVQHADVAQEVAKTGSFADVTVKGKFSPRPVLFVWLVATGVKVFGVNELAGRLPLALCGVLALLLIYRVGRRLFSERAGLVSAAVLATTPVFLFQSRQLISDLPTCVSLLASLGGLAAYLWPSDGRRSPFDLVIAGAGLVAGFLAAGLIIGVAFPLFALTVTLPLCWSTRNQPASDGAWPAATGPDLAAGQSLGQALRAALIPMLATVAAAALAIGGLLAWLKVTKVVLWGGEWRPLDLPPGFDTVFKNLGFGFYPWFALLPFVMMRMLRDQKPLEAGTGAASADALPRPRTAFPQMLVLVATVGAYILTSFWLAYMGSARYPALPFLALAVGVVFWDVLRGVRRVHRLWGIVTLGLIATLQQDFFMEPDGLAFSHLVTTAKYPVDLSIKTPVRIFGGVFGLLFFLGLGGLPGIIRRDFKGAVLGWLANKLGGFLNILSDGLRAVGGATGKRFAWIALGAALVFGGWCAFYLTPHLSLHLSNKGLFETFHRCRGGDERLAQYQVAGRGAAYYNKGQIEEVRDQAQLFTMLREPRRTFVLIPTGYLASIDQAAREAKVTYYVLDDRNSQYLIISNKLAGTCNADLNPLRRYVLSTPPNPRKKLVANFENKVKLIGYDVADTVTRGGKFTITLYFQVLSRMPAGYKLFIHFDQPANRFHGDHEPLDGKYPTQYWLPGDYIVDPHDVEIPFITTPAGPYDMFVGFWLGEGRLKITEGPNDGVNRVPLGSLKVR
jgi:hypothetical protein